MRREREARLKSGRREGMQAQMTAMEGSRADQMPAFMKFPDGLLGLCVWWVGDGRGGRLTGDIAGFQLGEDYHPYNTHEDDAVGF